MSFYPHYDFNHRHRHHHQADNNNDPDRIPNPYHILYNIHVMIFLNFLRESTPPNSFHAIKFKWSTSCRFRLICQMCWLLETLSATTTKAPSGVRETQTVRRGKGIVVNNHGMTTTAKAVQTTTIPTNGTAYGNIGGNMYIVTSSCGNGSVGNNTNS
jgi:hypothetical protein